jgi:hypothetical protein
MIWFESAAQKELPWIGGKWYMIIDGHAHACGEFLHVENVVQILDANRVDKIAMVPGEMNSEKNYSLPELAGSFPLEMSLRGQMP